MPHRRRRSKSVPQKLPDVQNCVKQIIHEDSKLIPAKPKLSTNQILTIFAQDNCCGICHENTMLNKMRTNGCEHEFCKNCILEWWKEKNWCPQCQRIFWKLIDVRTRVEQLIKSFDEGKLEEAKEGTLSKKVPQPERRTEAKVEVVNVKPQEKVTEELPPVLPLPLNSERNQVTFPKRAPLRQRKGRQPPRHILEPSSVSFSSGSSEDSIFGEEEFEFAMMLEQLKMQTQREQRVCNALVIIAGAMGLLLFFGTLFYLFRGSPPMYTAFI